MKPVQIISIILFSNKNNIDNRDKIANLGFSKDINKSTKILLNQFLQLKP